MSQENRDPRTQRRMGHQPHLLIMRISESEPRIRAPSASEWVRWSTSYSSKNPTLTRRSS